MRGTNDTWCHSSIRQPSRYPDPLSRWSPAWRQQSICRPAPMQAPRACCWETAENSSSTCSCRRAWRQGIARPAAIKQASLQASEKQEIAWLLYFAASCDIRIGPKSGTVNPRSSDILKYGSPCTLWRTLTRPRRNTFRYCLITAGTRRQHAASGDCGDQSSASSRHVPFGSSYWDHCGHYSIQRYWP